MRNLKYILTLCVLALGLISCEETSHPAVDMFAEMQGHQQQLDFIKLKPYLNDTSLKFIEELIQANNPSELMGIGKKYKLNYFMAEYYRWDRSFNTDFEKIFKLLNVRQFSFFDLKYQFESLEKKAKRESVSYYLPLTYNFHGINKLRWIRFEKEKDDNYKFDLIYSLEQEDATCKGNYRHLVDKSKDAKGVSEYEILYSTLPETSSSPQEIMLTLTQLNKERLN